MIAHNAQLSIRRISLSHLQVVELAAWTCYPERFMLYLQLLQDFPDEDVDPLIVTPSTTHPGIFPIKNGKHRYCASIIAGRKDVLCVVEEPA